MSHIVYEIILKELFTLKKTHTTAAVEKDATYSSNTYQSLVRTEISFCPNWEPWLKDGFGAVGWLTWRDRSHIVGRYKAEGDCITLSEKWFLIDELGKAIILHSCYGRGFVRKVTLPLLESAWPCPIVNSLSVLFFQEAQRIPIFSSGIKNNLCVGPSR